MRTATLIVLYFILSGLNAWAAEPSKPADPAPALEIKCERDGDSVKLGTEGDKTFLAVRSERGIGGATVTRTGDHWPKEIVLRMYLRGLEQISIGSGDVRLVGSVLSHSGHKRLLHLWKKNAEGPPIEKDSPYWMDIRIFNGEGKAIDGLPGKGGWFEMTISKALLADQEKVLAIHWIDFFR